MLLGTCRDIPEQFRLQERRDAWNTFFWFSPYGFITARGTPPTVETKSRFVHNVGSRG